MASITLQPELVTSSGAAYGIMWDDHYVGSLTFVYRENDRMWGTVQLDEDMLEIDEKEQVDRFLHDHIEHMIEAVGATECFMTVTYSEYDHVVSTEMEEDLDNYEYIDDENDEEMYLDEDDLVLDEDDIDTEDHIVMVEEDGNVVYEQGMENYFQLTITREMRDRVEYQIHNIAEDVIAEAIVHISGEDVTGEVIWEYDPTDAEVDGVTKLLVSDFDPDEIDTFAFVMYYDDEEVASVELTHNDLFDDDIVSDDHEGANYLDEMEDDDEEYVNVYDDDSTDLYFELIRDDVDVMMFDIYEDDGRKDSRLGMITVDLSETDVTAFVEFINPRDRHLREQIAYHFIDELDEEIGFESLTMTMQYDGEVIDEYHFDQDEQLDSCHVHGHDCHGHGHMHK